MTIIQDARNNIFAAVEKIANKANSYEYETYNIKAVVGMYTDYLVCTKKDPEINGEVVTPGSNLFKVIHDFGYRVDFLGCDSNKDELNIFIKKL